MNNSPIGGAGHFRLRSWQPTTRTPASGARTSCQTFLERDLPQLGLAIPALRFFRFWHLLAHYHGQIWNAAEAARALDVSEAAVRRYLDNWAACSWCANCHHGTQTLASAR